MELVKVTVTNLTMLVSCEAFSAEIGAFESDKSTFVPVPFRSATLDDRMSEIPVETHRY